MRGWIDLTLHKKSITMIRSVRDFLFCNYFEVKKRGRKFEFKIQVSHPLNWFHLRRNYIKQQSDVDIARSKMAHQFIQV